jgi:negative regulator of sigma E activity
MVNVRESKEQSILTMMANVRLCQFRTRDNAKNSVKLSWLAEHICKGIEKFIVVSRRMRNRHGLLADHAHGSTFLDTGNGRRSVH